VATPTAKTTFRYVPRRYLTPQIAQDIPIAIANATFAARDASLWGEGTITVAFDSTHVRAYDQNIFTEWHSRYGGRGILIYWHVEPGSMVVHSQTLRASEPPCADRARAGTCTSTATPP
jgi:TnpA family transposase